MFNVKLNKNLLFSKNTKKNMEIKPYFKTIIAKGKPQGYFL
jgi:hypothetical protein